MATLLKCPGLEVDVWVDNSPLRKYDDHDKEEPASNTMTKYIESKSGARYNALFEVRGPFPLSKQVKAQLYIDGAKPKSIEQEMKRPADDEEGADSDRAGDVSSKHIKREPSDENEHRFL
ncbi:hypothetical protein B0J11DRAFT_579829 [Dendryphion nanum]|uniref:DUF7918 domain-containing protein n=1 Tax=Dendryphion nanum TaxID=256645 RepID=A0A9P9ILW7_9PLEO|nr:hypothetical protein B0J11DRAFT_579829 [Dendryphion nanum]